MQLEPSWSTRLAAEDAARRMAETFAHTGELADMADRPNDTAQAEAAAVSPCSASVGYEGVFFDAQRIFHFDRLDRQVRGIGDVDLHAVFAVPVVASAHAATERLEIDVRLPGLRVRAGEHHAGVCTVGTPDRTLRHPVGERAEHHVDHTLAGVGAQ